MPRAFYPSYLEDLLTAAVDHNATTVAAVGVDGYVYDPAHDNLDDIGGRVVGAAWGLGATTVSGPAVHATSATAAAVPIGATIRALVFYVDTGVEATSRVVAYVDDHPALPMATNGQDITLNVDPAALILLTTAPAP